jgi:hypothetical protein
VTDCGHPCCQIRQNGFHAHPDPPEHCPHCRALAVSSYRIAGPARRDGPCRPRAAAPVIEHLRRAGGAPDPVDVEHMADEVARIVQTVITRIAPHIPDIPAGAELDQVVLAHALRIYVDALDEPQLHGVDARQWRAVLAGRVGLALAFPDTGRRG